METYFNGKIYLTRHQFYSRQYLGSGKTRQESISDFWETVKELNLKPLNIAQFY